LQDQIASSHIDTSLSVIWSILCGLGKNCAWEGLFCDGIWMVAVVD